MIDEKEDIYYGDLTKMGETIHKERVKILNHFAAAYLAETKIMPSELVLVTKRKKIITYKYLFFGKQETIETTMNFRRKSEEKETNGD